MPSSQASRATVLADARSKGVRAREMKAAGFDAAVLKGAGYDSAALKGADFDFDDLIQTFPEIQVVYVQKANQLPQP